MAQMIGTNITVDGAPESKLMISIIEWLEKKLPYNNSQESVFRRQLRKAFDHGANPFVLPVPMEHGQEVREALLRADIPFVLTKSPLGEYIFMTDEEHKNALQEAANDVLSLSSDYYTQQTAAKIADISSKEGIMTKVSFRDEDMYLIARDQMVRNGIVHAELDFRGDGKEGAGNIYLAPQNLYSTNENRKDAAFVELNQAYTQSMADMSDTMLVTRKAQAVYDNEQETKLAYAVREGKSRVMCDAKDPNGMRLEAKNGKLIKYENAQDKTGVALDIKDTDSIASIRSVILKSSSEVLNKMTLTDAEYDAHKEGKLNWVGFRPEYRGDDIKLHEAGKKVQREFDRAYRKVTGNMAADGRDLTPHNGYVEKKARIASLLKDRIKELEAEGEDPAVTKWLTKTVEHFEDTHEKSKDEYYVEEISLRSKAEIRETTTEIYKEEIRAREAAERRGEIEKVETTEKATEYEREY